MNSHEIASEIHRRAIALIPRDGSRHLFRLTEEDRPNLERIAAELTRDTGHGFMIESDHGRPRVVVNDPPDPPKGKRPKRPAKGAKRAKSK
jgi:hypothetical protein